MNRRGRNYFVEKSVGSEGRSVEDLVVEGIEKLLCSRGEALGLPISPAWRFELGWARKRHGLGN